MKDTTLEGIKAQERTLMNIIQIILRFHPQMRNISFRNSNTGDMDPSTSPFSKTSRTLSRVPNGTDRLKFPRGVLRKLIFDFDGLD